LRPPAAHVERATRSPFQGFNVDQWTGQFRTGHARRSTSRVRLVVLLIFTLGAAALSLVTLISYGLT